MEKTVKLHAYAEPAKSDAAQEKLAQDCGVLLAEERNKSLDLLKTIVQLRESLKQEQVKSAELEARINKLSVLEDSQLARKNAQLEEEKKKVLEYERTISELRNSLKQEQARTEGMADSSAELEAKTKELAALEAKIRDMSGVISKISSIALAAGSGDGK